MGRFRWGCEEYQTTPHSPRVGQSQHGYPLQTVIGAYLKGRHFHLDEEWAYVDADSSETRTLDIHAGRRLQRLQPDDPEGLGLGLSLLIECKQSDQPHVLFEAVAPPPPLYFIRTTGFPKTEVSVSTTDERRSFRIPLQQALGLHLHRLITTPPVASSMSRVSRKGKKIEVSGESSYRELVLPLTKAASDFSRRHAVREGRTGPWFGRIFLSIAVLDAPLALARVPGHEPALQMVPWCRVLRRHAASTRDVWREPKPTFIDVVHAAFFEDFISKYVIPFGTVATRRVVTAHNVVKTGVSDVGLDIDRPVPRDIHKRIAARLKTRQRNS